MQRESNEQMREGEDKDAKRTERILLHLFPFLEYGPLAFPFPRAAFEKERNQVEDFKREREKEGQTRRL